MNESPQQLRDTFQCEWELLFNSDLMSAAYAIEGEKLNEVREANEAFSNDALRVRAYGYKKLPAGQSSITEEDERNLVLVGLTVMIDLPRETVYGFIEEAKSTVICTIMITGDHKLQQKRLDRTLA